MNKENGKNQRLKWSQPENAGPKHSFCCALIHKSQFADKRVYPVRSPANSSPLTLSGLLAGEIGHEFE